jgi:hypothetical protein
MQASDLAGDDAGWETIVTIAEGAADVSRRVRFRLTSQVEKGDFVSFCGISHLDTLRAYSLDSI